jgi:hypothetical protein
MRALIILVVAVVAGAAAGCTVGPDYKRPLVTVPDTYRGAPAPGPAAADAASIGDQAWWDVFQDDQGRKSIALMPGCPMEPKAVRRDSRDCAVRGSSCAPAPSSLLR